MPVRNESVGLDDRSNRYGRILPPTVLRQSHAVVVGIGSVGRPLTLMLASMGVGNLSVYDPDSVSRTNLGSQGYPENQAVVHAGRTSMIPTLDELKTDVLGEEVACLNPTLFEYGFVGLAEKFPTDLDTIRSDRSLLMGEDPTVLFLCVDTMKDRLAIVEAALRAFPSITIIDTRADAETGRVVVVPNPVPGIDPFDQSIDDRLAFYKARWFPDSEGLDSICGYRATLYGSTAVACLAIARWTRLVRVSPDPSQPNPGLSVEECDTLIDLAVGSITPNPS